MSKKFNVLHAGILYVIGSFFAQGLRFLTLPIFSRVMSPDDYGFIGSYELWVSILTVFVGLQTAATIPNAFIDFGEKKVDRFTSSVLMTGILSTIIILIIIVASNSLLVTIFELEAYILIVGLIQCLFSYCISMLTSKYRIQERVISFLVFSIGSSVLSIVSAIILTNSFETDKYVGYIFGMFVGYLIMGIIAVFTVYCADKCIYDIEMISYALKLSTPLILHTLATVILSRINQLMLLKFIGPTEAGLYNFGNNFAFIVNGIYTAFNQAYLPWYYKRLHAKDTITVRKTSEKYIELFTLFVAGLILIIPEVIRIMSTEEYYYAMYIVPIVIVGMDINYLYTFPVNYEFYHKKTQFIATGTIFAAICNVILNLILINNFGIIGAGVATAMSSCVLLLFHFIIAKYIVKEFELSYVPFIKGIVFVCITMAVYYFIIDSLIIRGIIILALLCVALTKVKGFLKTIQSN